MSWLLLTTLFVSQAVQPAPGGSGLDVLVRLEAGASVGVVDEDRWVLADEFGARVSLPAGMIRYAAPAASVDAREADLARELGLDRWVRIQLLPGADRAVFLTALEGLDVVEHAELDAIGGLADLPDDPLFPDQWGLRNTGQFVGGLAGVPGADIDIEGAWERITGSDGLVIATLDSGAYDHTDLGGRVLQGRNIPDGTDDGTDVCASHGTHVAGIIAASGDNGIGVAGIDRSALILPVVIVGPCSGPESWPADGLIWAADNGADIINMSLQYSTGTEYFHDAVRYAAALDIPMIAATGNSNGPVVYPARWPEVIAVGSIDNQDSRSSFSNYGPEVDLVAPGSVVTSTQSFSSYGTKSGTSFAAPHVTGVVSLMLALDPGLTSEEIRAILTATARDVGLLGFDTATGHGCLDADAALDLLGTPAPDPDFNGDGVVDGDDLLRVLAAWGACAGCPEDLDADGLVDGSDLLVLLSAWSV